MRRGARVVLISGPTRLTPPLGVDVINVRTAEEMYSAVLAGLNDATIIIKAAAVADYRPVSASEQKIKKTDSQMTVQLERTPDILAEVGRRKGSRLLIGFAAAAISALTVCYIGTLFSIPGHIARVTGAAGSYTCLHVLSYVLGLPLSWGVMYFLFFQPKRPLARYVEKL